MSAAAAGPFEAPQITGVFRSLYDAAADLSGPTAVLQALSTSNMGFLFATYGRADIHEPIRWLTMSGIAAPVDRPDVGIVDESDFVGADVWSTLRRLGLKKAALQPYELCTMWDGEDEETKHEVRRAITWEGEPLLTMHTSLARGIGGLVVVNHYRAAIERGRIEAIGGVEIDGAKPYAAE